jgi:hypothetical protein
VIKYYEFLKNTKVIKKIKNKIKTRKIRKAQEREYLRTLPSAFDHAALAWIAPEHHEHQRGKFWHVIMGGMLLAAVITAFVHNAWTFSLAILAAALAYYTAHREPHKQVEIKISEIGIKVGNRKYSFGKIRAFWIHYDPPITKTLNIKVDDDLAGEITIQLHNQNPAEVREFLIDKIPELSGRKEAIGDIFAKLFKL